MVVRREHCLFWSYSFVCFLFGSQLSTVSGSDRSAVRLFFATFTHASKRQAKACLRDRAVSLVALILSPEGKDFYFRFQRSLLQQSPTLGFAKRGGGADLHRTYHINGIVTAKIHRKRDIKSPKNPWSGQGGRSHNRPPPLPLLCHFPTVF
jgi:hypothetical protein